MGRTLQQVYKSKKIFRSNYVGCDITEANVSNFKFSGQGNIYSDKFISAFLNGNYKVGKEENICECD